MEITRAAICLFSVFFCVAAVDIDEMTPVEIMKHIAKNPPQVGVEKATMAALFGSSVLVKEMAPDAMTEKVLNGSTPWIVDFYVDHCDKCKKLVPLMSQVASTFTHEPDLNFAAINCNEHNVFCQKVGVTSHPTLKAYHFPWLAESTTNNGFDIPLNIENYTKIGQWIEKNLEGYTQNMTAGQEAPPIAAPSPKPVHAVASKSTAEKRLIDAQVALLFTFRRGAFLHADVTDAIDDPEMVLSGEPLQELKEWLKILPSIFTSPGAQRDLNHLADIAAKYVGRDESIRSDLLEWSKWQEAIDKQGLDTVPMEAGKDPREHWKLCGGYTCGLWSLFHLLTVAVAENRAGGLTAQDAIERIRGFVRNFFSCAECVEHFLNVPAELPEMDAPEGKRLVAWLWQIHNEVSERVAAENQIWVSENVSIGKKHEDWPSHADCPRCWPKGAGSDEASINGIYDYVRSSYVAPGPDGWSTHRKKSEKKPAAIDSAERERLVMLNNMLYGFTAVCAIAVIVVIFVLVKMCLGRSKEETEMEELQQQILGLAAKAQKTQGKKQR